MTMIPRIRKYQTLPDYRLLIEFDDGTRVTYDVKEDLSLPGYEMLSQVTGLFDQAQLDQSRTCLYWTEDIDLPSDILYEYGIPA